MSDKPKMYKLETRKEFTNNQSVFLSYNNNTKLTVNDIIDIRKKINNLFNSSDFIYSKKVNIVVDNQILTKKVIGIYNNNLVTIDNEQIPLNIIKDIYKYK